MSNMYTFYKQYFLLNHARKNITPLSKSKISKITIPLIKNNRCLKLFLFVFSHIYHLFSITNENDSKKNIVTIIPLGGKFIISVFP